MPVTSLIKDPEALTMTVVADFAATVERVWEAYTDPRQLERFWGPPGWPSTFTRHDVFPGGRSAYWMTGPDGERAGGWWEFLAVDPGRSFEVLDGFAGADGEPDLDMPTMRMVFEFAESGDGCRLTTTTYFNSADDLEQVLEMGMDEGLEAAMGQIDDVLADLASFAAGRATEAQILSDTQVRVSRVIRGSVDQVWEAHHDPALLARWQLGPDGWTMPVCELAESVGDTYRMEWENAESGERFGFTGEVLEQHAPYREVSTESQIGTEGPGVVNEMTLTPLSGGTLLTYLMTYPDAELRDIVLGTGMVDGMEASYVRLESEVFATA